MVLRCSSCHALASLGHSLGTARNREQFMLLDSGDTEMLLGDLQSSVIIMFNVNSNIHILHTSLQDFLLDASPSRSTQHRSFDGGLTGVSPTAPLIFTEDLTSKIVLLERQELVAGLAQVTQDCRLHNLCPRTLRPNVWEICPRIGVFGFRFQSSYSAWKTRSLACCAPARDRTTVYRATCNHCGRSQRREV